MSSVSRLTVRGFRSIADFERLELDSLNVLIGPNGAGKSNLLDVFRLLRAVAGERLRMFVAEEDGPEALLFRGRKHTKAIDIECAFGETAYVASLVPVGEGLVFARESIRQSTVTHDLGSGHPESRLASPEAHGVPIRFIREAMSKWRVYHFHDTSTQSAVRHAQPVRDNIVLHSDGSNIAPYLRRIRERHPNDYRQILNAVRLAVPFLDDFVYLENPGERVGLDWFERDLEQETPHGMRRLSDGTIRFICLATLLLQPIHMQPPTILIDEPELGLHPFALALVAELLQTASASRQIVVATQSPDLISDFDAKDVVTVGRLDGRSRFERPDENCLQEWLEEYALGDLWRMNVVGASPSR